MCYLTSNRSDGLFNWHKFKKLSLFLIFTATSLSAKDINLTTAINLMTDNNPSLRQFAFKQTALDGDLQTANLKPEMVIGFDAENILGSSPYTGLSQSELTVSLSSVLEFGNKRQARYDLVSTKKQLLEANKQVRTIEVFSDLTRSYIAILATQERIELAKESTQLAQDIYTSVKRRAAAGAISDAEVKRAFSTLQQAKLTQQAELQKFSIQKVNLSLYWAERSPQFSAVTGELFKFGELQTLDALYAKLEHSSRIQVLTNQQQLAESKLRLARVQSKSNISWSLGVRRFEESNDSALTAGFSVPLFKSKRNAGKLITAQAEIDQSLWLQKTTLLQLYGQLHEINTLRKQSVQEFTVLQNDIVPALSSALNLTKRAYDNGRYGYLEYSAARQELIESKKALIDTAESILIYGVEIEQITAEPAYINITSIAKQITGQDS